VARTRFQSLSSRIQLGNIQGPSGIGAREQGRTLSLLSSELNKMSNFFFKRAEAEAQIQGEKFGAENTPTVQDYQKSIAKGENPLEQFDRKTVFGSSAFNQVAKTLGNSLIVSASNQMNQRFLEVEQTPISIDEFKKDLNAIILETSKLAYDISPGIGEQITSDLSIKANGHFYKYGVQLNKITTRGLQSGATLILDNHLNNLESEITAILPKNTDTVNQKELAQKIYGKGGIKDSLLNKYSQTMIGARFEKEAFRSGVKDWNTAFKTSMFSTLKTLALNNGKDVSDITDDLRRGKATGDKIIDALVSGLSGVDRKQLATEITTMVNNQNSIEDLADEETNALAGATASELEVKITNDIEQGKPQATIIADLAKLKKLVDLDDETNAWETLTKKNNKAGGVRTVSVQKTFLDLNKKAGFGTLTYKQLNDKADQLIPKDFNSILTKLNGQQSQSFADAKTILAKELGFLVDREIRDQKDPQYAKGEVFVQILGKLQEQELNYNKTKTTADAPFNHVKVVQDLVKVDGELILQEIFTKKRDSFKRNYFDTFVREFPDLISADQPMTRANVLKMEDRLEDMLEDKNKRKGVKGTFESGNEKKEKARIETFISITKSMLAEERFSQ